MMRVAIPVSGEQLSGQFEKGSHYRIYEIDDKATISNRLEVSAEEFLAALPDAVLRYGVTDIIAHNIGRQMLDYLLETKINVFVGVGIDDPERLIEEYLKGSLRSDIHELID